LRFGEFEGEWEKKKLGEICELTSSKRIYLSEYIDNGIPFYRGKEISELKQNIQPKDILYISPKLYNEYKDKYGVPQINDILITAIGTLGNVLVIKSQAPFYFKDGNLIWLRNINLNSDFLAYLLEVNRTTLELSAIGSSQKALTMVELRKLIFSIPFKEEQNKIATLLSLLDDRISTQSQIIEGLKSLMNGLIYYFVKNKVVNVRLKDCLNCNSSTLTESEVVEQNGNYPVYGATGIIAQTSNYIIDNEAILIIKDGSSVGKIQYASDKFSVIGTLNYLTPKENVSLKFFYYSLQVFNFEKYIVGSGIPHIYFKDYGNEYIYCPPIKEQNEIANFLSSIDEKIETEKQILKKYTEQKKYLLTNMFI
jgi:type I restriction enzyme S subunit